MACHGFSLKREMPSSLARIWPCQQALAYNMDAIIVKRLIDNPADASNISKESLEKVCKPSKQRPLLTYSRFWTGSRNSAGSYHQIPGKASKAALMLPRRNRSSGIPRQSHSKRSSSSQLSGLYSLFLGTYLAAYRLLPTCLVYWDSMNA